MKLLLYFLIGFILAITAGIASAGYYATTVSCTGSVNYQPCANRAPYIGNITSCYLTPSMAVNSLPKYNNGGPWQVSAMTETSSTSQYSIEGTAIWTISIATCTANPNAMALPLFLGAASDPVITSGNYSTSGGTSTSGGSCTPFTPEQLAFLTGGFDGDVATLAFTGTMLLFAVGLGIGLVVSQVRKLNRI